MSTVECCRSERLHAAYYRITHDSGLKIIYYPIDRSQTFVNLKVGFGSSDNRFVKDGETVLLPDGCAHFLEHKMFDCPNGADGSALLAALGADSNAYTAETETVYMFSCADNFDKSLKILLEFVNTPHFTEKSLKKEIPIISEEIAMYRDLPDNKLLYALLRAMYRKSPVRRDVAGSKSSIRKITPEILYSCTDAFYVPSNMALCVAGKSSPEEIIGVCDCVLGRKYAEPAERIPEDEPDGVFKKSVTVYDNVNLPKCAVGIKIGGVPDDPKSRANNRALLRMLCSIMFGRSSDFAESLYSDGVIASPLSADTMYQKGFAYLQIAADCRNPNEFSEKVLEYVDKIRRDGIDGADFERCKRALYGAWIADSDSSEAMSDILLPYAFEGIDPFENIEYMLGADRDDINRFASEILSKKRISVAALLPNSEENNSENI